ncbi:MAG TPA: nicotinate-nicotinamide nucleotide adenylyltransferase, partial [Spirochaetia bacterium]|nr:nicotinate-nicotinamide nucleotide adenylyltransferase [Spirochaetia bacterium]
RAAAADDDRLVVWDGEIRRGGLSYTIDTIRELARSFELEGKPGLLVGDDLLPGFSEWRQADALAREARIVCARRERADRVAFPYDHVYLDNLLIPVSSRMIRERIAAGQPYRRLVPDPVWRIIEENGYYRRG